MGIFYAPFVNDMIPRAYSYTRYLAAKESVDQRAVNLQVWNTLIGCLEQMSSTAPIRCFEVGGGVGATFRRLLKALPDYSLEYTLLDIEVSHLAYFETHLSEWMEKEGFVLTSKSDAAYFFGKGERTVKINVILADIEAYLQAANTDRYDLLIAQAFLDLFDLDDFIPRLHTLLKPEGLYYYPINFDGITAFLPEIQPEQDDQYERLYHESMDIRNTRPGSRKRSQTGRSLYTVLSDLGTKIVRIGSSDWLVYAQPDGVYPQDEGYFLHHILHFFEQELSTNPSVNKEQFKDWLAIRRSQVETGALFYMAHQLDFLGINAQ